MDACNTPLTFRPGDDAEINTLESGEYRHLPRTRSGELGDFVTGDEFRSSTASAAISALPRWRYTMELNKKPRTADTGDDSNRDALGSESDGNSDYVSPPNKLRGAARAHRGFLDGRRIISQGWGDLFEFLAHRESDAPIIRLEIWRSVVCLNAPRRNVRGY